MQAKYKNKRGSAGAAMLADYSRRNLECDVDCAEGGGWGGYESEDMASNELCWLSQLRCVYVG